MGPSPVNFQSSDRLAYIPSTGRGDDRGVHHRLPDGTAVTYADIRRAVEEGRGDEDVSPYFTGQTNAQALGTHQIVKLIEDPPPVVGAIFALAQRSWFSLATVVASALGTTEEVKTALTEAPSKPEEGAEAGAEVGDEAANEPLAAQSSVLDGNAAEPPLRALTDALEQPAAPVFMAAEALRIRQDIER